MAAEPRQISAFDFISVHVSLAADNYIQSMKSFESLADAIEYVQAAPAGQKWSMTFTLKFRRTFPMNYPVNDGNAVFSINGPGYVGCFYD